MAPWVDFLDCGPDPVYSVWGEAAPPPTPTTEGRNNPPVPRYLWYLLLRGSPYSNAVLGDRGRGIP